MTEEEKTEILLNAYFNYRKKLVSEMFFYTNDYDLAEDCVHDGFCALQNKLCRNERIDDIQAFVFAVAKKSAVIYSKWYSDEIGMEDVCVADNLLRDKASEGQISAFENKELIRKYLSELSPLNRKLFVFRLNGLEYTEIGRKVGMSGEAVRKVINRIQKQLKKEILDERGAINLCSLMRNPLAIF